MDERSNQNNETTPCPVNSHNEWDPLEEIVVGTIEEGVFPTWQETMMKTMPRSSWDLFRTRGGTPLPFNQVQKAMRELDTFAELLGNFGVTVVRPEVVKYSTAFSTPNWKVNGGLYGAMPRDCLLVIGDAIIEAPMAWRCRYHEVEAFRPLIKEYFCRGARWLPAPRPQLVDDLYEARGGEKEFAITEFEPVFDAADFVRLGSDILVQKSHVTNTFGIDWLQRAVGSDYRVTTIQVNDPHAMHIDATIVPLAPGRLLVNPERYISHPIFKDWEIIEAPRPALPRDWPMYFSSSWLSMNTLSLDDRTVVVERQELSLIDVLTARGFECIPVDFRHFYSFGGSFHCATLDIRRRSSLTS